MAFVMVFVTLIIEGFNGMTIDKVPKRIRPKVKEALKSLGLDELAEEKQA